MKKITTTLLIAGVFAPVFAFAETPVTNAVPAVTTATPVVATFPPMTCIVKAYDTRENTVITAFDAFNVSVKAALHARKDLMISALSAPDKVTRKSLRLKSWNVFDATMKVARIDLKNARTKAQDIFKSEAKVCGKIAETTLEGFKEQSSLPSAN